MLINNNSLSDKDRLSFVFQLTDEFARCEELKLQNIKKFVDATRIELDQLWDKCYVPKEVRNQFKAYFEGGSLW